MNKGITKKTISILVSFIFLVNTTGIGWFVPEAEAEEALATEVEAAEVEAAEVETQSTAGQGGMTAGEDGDVEPQSTPASPNDTGVSLPQNILSGFQVDQFTGSGMMNVPIEVPEGPGGLKPSINLIYNSSNKNGWLGMGWDLNLGYIQRSTKEGIPQYNSNDDFICVLPTGGIELVGIGSGEYRAKIEQAFMKFYTDGTYWYAWDRDGTEYTFSQYEYKNPASHDTIFRWYLTQIKDLHNNQINLSYLYPGYESTRAFYCELSEITYGKTKISFNSLSEEDRTDKEETTDSSRGWSYAYRDRLNSIDVYYNNQLVRKYGLSYIYSSDSKRSLLAQITQYGSNGTTPLPPIKFSYQGNGGIHKFSGINPGVSLSSDYKIYPGDYNGDGKTDFVAFRGSGNAEDEDMALYLSNGTNFNRAWSYHNAITGWDFYYTDQFYPGDYNGDGKSDLFAYSDLGDRIGIILFEPSDPYRPYAPSDSVTSNIGNWSVSGANYYFYPGDYSGDGKTELFVGRKYFAGYCDNKNQIPLFLYDIGLLSFENSFSLKWSLSSFSSGCGGISLNFYSGDYNGDRKTDIVSYVGVSEAMKLLLSNGNSFSDVWNVSGSMTNWDFSSGDSFVSGDYNGDGRTDLFAISDAQDKGGLLISNGSSFDAVWSNNYFDPGSSDPWSISGSNQTYFSGDFRAIGKADIFAVDKNSKTDIALVKYTKNYDDAFDKIWWTMNLDDYSKFTSGDFNGDGKADILFYYDGDIWLLVSQGVIPDLLNKIENGLGGSINVSYAPSTYYSNTFLPMVKQVVSSVTLNDGLENTSVTTNYTYSGGLFDTKTREFRGFNYSKVTDQEGNFTETYFLQDEILKGKPEKVYVKDKSGNNYRMVENTWQTQDTEWGSDTTFPYLYQTITNLYDASTTPYLSKKTTYAYDSYGNVTETKEYDPSGNPYRSTHAEYKDPDLSNWILGRPTHTYIKDSSSVTKQESWMSYTDYGDISTVTAWLDTAADPVVTYKYDSYGNQTEVIDANGNKITYTYDSSTNYIFPHYITNALGHTITYSYDLGTGNVASITDVNGNATSYDYDVFGRLTKMIKSGDSDSYPTTEYSYNEFGTLGSQRITTKQRVYSYSQVSEDRVFTSSQYFDGLGRVYQVARPLKKEGSTIYYIMSQIKYDWKGRQSQASLPYFDVGGSAKWETTTYDLLDRPKTIAHPDGTQKTFTYSGTKIIITDENGNSRKLNYDAWGNLVNVYEYLDANTYTTAYEYDILGNLKKITDAKSNLWIFNYDSLGRITNSSDPDRGYWQFPEYDNNGNLKKKIDGKGVIHQYFYDTLNRPTYLYLDGNLEEQYAYDTATNGKGLLYKVEFNKSSDFPGEVYFSYDVRGRISSKTQTTDSVSRTANFTYTSHDAPLTIKYPDGETITYEYGYHNSSFTSYVNNFGLVSKIPNYIDTISYNAALQKTYVDFANNTATTYTYDSNRLWLTNIQTTNNLQSLSYGYDKVGNLTSITDSLPPYNSQSFGYDSLNRLSSASGPYGALNYAYDEIGNIVNKEGTTLYYQGSRPHAVTSTSSGHSFDYDPNGNLTYDTGTSFTYDVLNRLSFTMGDKDAGSFLYDYTGSRIRKAVVDISCVCVCDNEIRNLDPQDLQENSYKYIIYFGKIYEYDKIKSSSKKYILLNNQRVALKDSSGTYFYHVDHLGSSQVISNSSGAEAQRLLYKPFGETYSEDGSQVTSYKFSGEEFDKEQGLYYFGSRYYNPLIGRFTQSDPKQGSLENPQTLNPYSYCANNPLTYVDPKGEFWWIIAEAIKWYAMGKSAVEAYRGAQNAWNESGGNIFSAIWGGITGGINGYIAGNMQGYGFLGRVGGGTLDWMAHGADRGLDYYIGNGQLALIGQSIGEISGYFLGQRNFIDFSKGPGETISKNSGIAQIGGIGLPDITQRMAFGYSTYNTAGAMIYSLANIDEYTKYGDDKTGHRMMSRELTRRFGSAAARLVGVGKESIDFVGRFFNQPWTPEWPDLYADWGGIDDALWGQTDSTEGATSSK